MQHRVKAVTLLLLPNVLAVHTQMSRGGGQLRLKLCNITVSIA